MPYRQPKYYCQPDPLETQQAQAMLESMLSGPPASSAQHGQGVVVRPPHTYGQSQGVTPPPPPPPPHNTPSSTTGPVCGPGWALPSAMPAPSPNVEHSQHGSAPSTQIHLAENQLQEQSLKEQFAAWWNRQAYSDAQIQQWEALSPEAQGRCQEREYAAFRYKEATRKKAEATNF